MTHHAAHQPNEHSMGHVELVMQMVSQRGGTGNAAVELELELELMITIQSECTEGLEGVTVHSHCLFNCALEEIKLFPFHHHKMWL